MNNGQRARGFVYAEGEEVLAMQYEGTNHVVWEHHDPAGQSVRMAEASGTVVDEREETASGAKIEKQDPYPSNPTFSGADSDGAYPFIGTVGKPMTGCTMEGILVPDCSWVLRDLNPFEYYESLAGVTFRRWVDPSSHRKPVHPPDPDDGVVRIYTDKEKLPGWEEWSAFFKIFGMVQTPKPHTVDWSVLESALKTCVKELWPMFEMTNFTPTAAPPQKKGKKADNSYNGVMEFKDNEFGTNFSVVNDPTPPLDVRNDIINHQARGRTDPRNPFWTYSYPAGDSHPRPGELRYPELLGQLLYVRVQIHETGSALTHLRNLYHPGPWAPRLPDGGLDPDHSDDGPSLEDCVGRHYYKQMGLTPH
jgi:hypothetical protein